MAREALLVGNTTSYAHGVAITSAPLLRRTLSRIESSLSSQPSPYAFRVTTLVDAKPGIIRQRLDSITERVSADDDLLLFYYFGHALLSDGFELSLVHPGPNRTSPRTQRLSALEGIVANSGVNKSIFILDCCYAGAQTRQIPFPLAGQHCRLASTTPTARAYMETGLLQEPIGFFTRAVLDGLSSVDACRSATDNTITAESLFNYASQLTRDVTNEVQQPVMLGTLLEPLTEHQRVPEIIPGITTSANEKTAYQKLFAIVQTIRKHKLIPDMGALYDVVLDEYPETFLTLHKLPNGLFEYQPVQEQAIYRYVRLLRRLGVINVDPLTLTRTGIGLVVYSGRSYNTRLLEAIDSYLASHGMDRQELDRALASILSSRRVTSRGELLDYLMLGGYRFPRQEFSTILDLLGYIGAIRMSRGRAYFPW